MNMATEKSAISLLNEYMQRMQISVKYELVSINEEVNHKPIFKMKVNANDLVCYGTGKSKKEARQQAAYNLLMQLDYDFENKRSETKIDYKVQSAVDALQELMLEKNEESPHYKLCPATDVTYHTGTFVVQVKAGNVTAFGEANTKGEAMRNAAQNALEQFTQQKVPNRPKRSRSSRRSFKKNSNDLTDSTDANIEKNSVEILKYFVEHSNFPAPSFKENSMIEPETGKIKFVSKCTVGGFSTRATRYSKKQALSASAFSMFNHLKELSNPVDKNKESETSPKVVPETTSTNTDSENNFKFSDYKLRKNVAENIFKLACDKQSKAVMENTLKCSENMTPKTSGERVHKTFQEIAKEECKEKTQIMDNKNTQEDSPKFTDPMLDDTTFVGTLAFIRDVMLKKHLTCEDFLESDNVETGSTLLNILSQLGVPYKMIYEENRDVILVNLIIYSIPKLEFYEIAGTKQEALNKIMANAMSTIHFICK